ncbi:DUF1918 domain-containing protein [Catelliglobosispora koreensis]|uniref:DUF1918 domain-containing protein n=1 Tax=Catelliglobosispora koreensis TaxID=129052 RepID=UPI000475CAC5|nr:DUF1918 domain-containing protein [Catelliglobosispora koreensis]
MKARIGDRLIIESHRTEVPRRIAVIEKVEHDDGSPPYWVKWLDTGHQALFSPGPDCHLDNRGSQG